MVYLFIFIIVVILARVNNRLSYRTRIWSLVCVCGYIVLLMGLRYRVGIDTLNYMSSYGMTPDLKDILYTDWSTARFEPGYLLLCSICRHISPEFWVLQLVHSLILNTCIFLFIYKNSANPFTGIAIYFVICWLYFNTEIIRESLAIAIFLLNYNNLKENKWIKYTLISLIAASFHYSALITLLFPIAKHLKVNLLYICACVLILGITPYLENINQLIAIASLSDRIGEHIGSANELNMNWRIANMIRYTIIPVCTLLLYRRVNVKSEFLPYILLSILFGIGAFAVPIIFSRLANYTLPFVIVYASNAIDMLSRRFKLKCALIIIIISSQLIYYNEMFYAWYPYESIFTQRLVENRELLWYKYFD